MTTLTPTMKNFECTHILDTEEKNITGVVNTYTVKFKHDRGDKIQIKTSDCELMDLFSVGVDYTVKFLNPQTSLDEVEK